MSKYDELKLLAEAIHGPGSTMQMLARWREFENACEPKLILAMIAENERLTAELDCPFRLARHSKRLVEQLRAQAEQYDQALIKMAAERDQLKAENERLAEEYDKAWRHDLNDKNNVHALSGEVARLSAENEALRKDAERWRFVRNPTATGSPFAVWSERTNLFLGKFADEAIDAAMGKGDQS